MLFIGSYIVPGSMILAIISGFIFSVGQGLETGSVTVLLADTVDYGEYKFGKRNESVTFSCQTLLVKFTSALTTMLLGWALTLTGYVPNAVQSASTLLGIRVIALVLPAIFALLSMFIYLKYLKLDKKMMDKVLKAIRKDKKNDTADRNTIAAPVYTDSAAADVIKADEEAIETN